MERVQLFDQNYFTSSDLMTEYLWESIIFCSNCTVAIETSRWLEMGCCKRDELFVIKTGGLSMWHYRG